MDIGIKNTAGIFPKKLTQDEIMADPSRELSYIDFDYVTPLSHCNEGLLQYVHGRCFMNLIHVNVFRISTKQNIYFL